MDITETAHTILNRLEAAATPERREVASWYFPSSMRAIGVGVPVIRAIAREIGKEIKNEPPRAVLDLVHALIATNTTECRQVGYEILERHKGAMASLDAAELQRLGTGNDNWGSVDAFACGIAGTAWRDGRIVDQDVVRWAQSQDRWWRRTALVSTVPLNMRSRGGSGDTARTLLICDMLAADKDDMVSRGLSWAIRALLEHDRQAVSDFLRRHEAVLASRVKREVRNKMETGLKSPKRPSQKPPSSK